MLAQNFFFWWDVGFKFGGECSNMPRHCLAFLIPSLFLFFCCRGLCIKHSLCQENSSDTTSEKPSLTIQQMLLSFITSFGILYFYSLYHGGVAYLFTCILLPPSGQGIIAYVWSLHIAWPAAGIPPNIFN